MTGDSLIEITEEMYSKLRDAYSSWDNEYGRPWDERGEEMTSNRKEIMTMRTRLDVIKEQFECDIRWLEMYREEALGICQDGGTTND